MGETKIVPLLPVPQTGNNNLEGFFLSLFFG